MALPDYYAILGVKWNAAASQIARAYRKQAFRWHPDRNPGREAEAHRRFVQVNEAFEVLGNALSRSEYDRSRGFAVARTHVTPSDADPPAEPSTEPARTPPPPDRRRRGGGLAAAAAAVQQAADARAAARHAGPTWRARLSALAWFPLALLLRLIGIVVIVVTGKRSTKEPERWGRFADAHPVIFRGFLPLLRFVLAASAAWLLWISRSIERGAPDTLASNEMAYALRLMFGAAAALLIAERLAYAVFWAASDRERGFRG